MTIALKIGGEDTQVKAFIYLDAVTMYTKNMSGKVTSHPVDSGVDISDHFISNNQKFQLDGVITAADITGISDLVRIGSEKPMNARARPSQPVITGPDETLKYLPQGAKQFFQQGTPSVQSTSSNLEVSLPEIEEVLNILMTANYYNEVDKRWRNKMVTTVLYEMDGNNFTNARTDLVITDVSLKEDPDSGDALFISLSLEKVRFVTLNQTQIPSKAKPSVRKKASDKESKGKQEAEKGVTDTDSNSTSKGAPKAPSNIFIQALERASG